MASATTEDQLASANAQEQENQAAQEAARLRARHGKFFWIALTWLAFIAFCAVFADLLPLQPNDEMDFTALSAPPWVAEGHWLGTDLQGRDVLSRILYGARVSLTVGLLSTSIGMTFGLLIGLLAGYYRGWVETSITLGLDTVLALPALVVLLLSSVIFGGGLFVISISLGFLLIPAFARVSRANTLNFAQREFVVAAKAMGAGDLRIIALEILPNVVLPVAAYALVVVAFAIVIEGALSFLGLSVPSPTPSWGGMIAEGRESLGETPHISFIPAIVMFLTVLSFNLVGDTLRSRLADLREAAV
ncbi:MAG: ABC transporter permease [Rhodospirillaceae bacterium]|jgi:peptide/nickel transport system permease protein|nr:ABC transporter permease [Rhodospirillaceae bacterium]MBT7760962.1 ABC transporter permease [Rhodospirillaceae bacterium]